MIKPLLVLLTALTVIAYLYSIAVYETVILPLQAVLGGVQ